MKGSLNSPFMENASFGKRSGFDAEMVTQSNPFTQALSRFVDKQLNIPPSESQTIEEKIKEYNTCFEEENILQNFLSENDYVSLGLPSYTYPKIHRGLPRTLKPNGKLEIKPSFRSHFALKRHLIDKAILYLYDNISFPHSHPLVIFTWVMTDGLGDFTAQKEIATIIHQKHPQLPLKLVTLIHENEKDKVTSPFETHFNTFANEQEINTSILSKASLNALSQASVILQTPTYFPDTPALLEKIASLTSKKKPPAYALLGEYGFIDSSWCHPLSGGRCMGLHFLEKGIIIKSFKEKSIDSLQNKEILSILLNDQDSFKKYQQTHHLHLAYLITKRGAFLYLYGLLRYLDEDPKDIDILINDIGPFIDEIQRDFAFGRHFNIQKIQIYFGKNLYEKKINAAGKCIRLIHSGHLNHSDFICLMQHAKSPISCRGDQSFSEVISLDKALFYDAPAHATPFLKDLCAISENRLSHFETTLSYLRLFIPSRGEDLESLAFKMGDLLKNKKTVDGLKRLNQIIKEEYTITPTLTQIVAQKMIHYHFPKVLEFEKKKIEEFCLGRLSFKELIKCIASHLNWSFYAQD